MKGNFIYLEREPLRTMHQPTVFTSHLTIKTFLGHFEGLLENF